MLWNNNLILILSHSTFYQFICTFFEGIFIHRNHINIWFILILNTLEFTVSQLFCSIVTINRIVLRNIFLLFLWYIRKWNMIITITILNKIYKCLLCTCNQPRNRTNQCSRKHNSNNSNNRTFLIKQ